MKKEKLIGRVTKHKDNTIDFWLLYESQDENEKELRGSWDPPTDQGSNHLNHLNYWPFDILKEISRLTSGS